jgi:hypothetical protein
MIRRVTKKWASHLLRKAMLQPLRFLACTSAQAQDRVAAFYSGRTISITIAYPREARTTSTPGWPPPHEQIHSRPSQFHCAEQAGRHRSAASFSEASPKDGSMIGIFPETIAIVQLTQPEIGKWKTQELNYHRLVRNINAVMMVRKGAPATTVEELQDDVDQRWLQHADRRFLHQPRDHEKVWRARVEDHLRIPRYGEPSDRAGAGRDRYDQRRMDRLE